MRFGGHLRFFVNVCFLDWLCIQCLCVCTLHNVWLAALFTWLFVGAGENVCLVNNICAFSSLGYSPDLFGSAVCATAATEWGARSQEGGGGAADISTDVICSLICIHPCVFIYTISLCLLSPSISSPEVNIYRKRGVTAVNNAQLSAYYWASASIYIKPPPEAKANIDVLMPWGKYYRESGLCILHIQSHSCMVKGVCLCLDTPTQCMIFWDQMLGA